MRSRLVLIGFAVVVVASAAFLYFRPDRLFVDSTVEDQVPAGVASAMRGESSSARLVSQGEWRSVEHPTSGRVWLVVDGPTYLVFEDLATDNGPDVHVWVSGEPASESDQIESHGVDIGLVKGNLGTQVYTVPASIDPANLKSAVLWCNRFSVAFGVADLA